MPLKIYAADDEKSIRDLIEAFLTREGFIVKTFKDGDSLLEACFDEFPDMVILDIMMPNTDGLTVCSTLRNMSETLPIIIVSAKDSPYDRVTGLTLGSDDYLVKPFLPLELVARIKALLRRSNKTLNQLNEDDELNFGDIVLNIPYRTTTISNKNLNLTPAEFDFLAYMITNSDRAVSREELLNAVWNINWQTNTRATDDLVKRLRRKLKENESCVSIDAVWGFGFKLSILDGDDEQ